MSFPPYPKYKPSGVEYLDEAPEHWDVKQLRFISRIRKGRLPAETFSVAEGDDLPYLSVEFLRDETEICRYVRPSADLVCSKPDDVLVLWDGSNAGEFLRGKTGVVSSTVAHLESRNVDKDFLFFACKSLEPQVRDQTVGMGIPHVASDELKSIKLALPKIVEQQTIAAFLSNRTNKLDRLIAKKRQLIERLQEKRGAIISSAVTRGLPKPSSRERDLVENSLAAIPWLTNSPPHWRALPFRRVTTRVDVGIAEAATHAYVDEGVPLVRSTNIKSGTVDTRELLFIDEEFATKLKSKTLRAGDIVTTRTGANLGVSAVIPNNLDGAQCFTLLISTPAKDCDPRYYNAFINADPGKSYFATASLGAGQHNISVPILQDMPTLRPPLPEQTAISSFIDAETAKIDNLIISVKSAIERLEEYRTALITAAVTGKIDVRKESHGK